MTITARLKAEHLDLAAAHLLVLAQMEVGLLPGDALGWDELTDGQRDEYRDLVRRAVDMTDRTRRWGMAPRPELPAEFNQADGTPAVEARS